MDVLKEARDDEMREVDASICSIEEDAIFYSEALDRCNEALRHLYDRKRTMEIEESERREPRG